MRIVCIPMLLVVLLIAQSSCGVYIYWQSCLIRTHELIYIIGIYLALEGHIWCWQMYGSNMVIRSCSLLILGHMCAVMLGLYGSLYYIFIVLVEFSSIFIVHLPSTVLYKFLFGSGQFTALCHTDMRSLPPISTPWGAYRSTSHTFSAVTFNIMPSQPYIPNIPLPRQVEVWLLGMFWWSTCSFLCTCHTPFFCELGTTLGNLLYAHPTGLSTSGSRTWYGHRSHWLSSGTSQDGYPSKYLQGSWLLNFTV